MQFTMSMDVPLPPAELWVVLTDVAQISQCIPGCEQVEEVDRLALYKAVVKQKIGPFKMEVPAEIVVEEVAEPDFVRTRATGRDRITGTTLAVTLTVTLEPAGSSSVLGVDALVEVQGRLATLGSSIIKRKAEQNFAEFEERLKLLLGVVA
jgi:carbon monoxide dehydrogenase subunit G